jgi:hypothetical protein
MKITIGNINVHNIDKLQWCLGEAGLAQMDEVVNEVMNDTVHMVEVDVNQLLSIYLGDMILELYKYKFVVVIA